MPVKFQPPESEVAFLARVFKTHSATADKWGWIHIQLGEFGLSTNGISYMCQYRATGRIAKLSKLIQANKES